MLETQQLQSLLDKVVDNKNIFGTSFVIHFGDEEWSGVSGNFTSPDEQYFIASTTKLFVTAVIMALRNEGTVKLADKISQFLDPSVMRGLHVLEGKDSSESITIAHLLAHTSGIPDYFQKKGADGTSLEDELMSGKDQYWSFDDCIKRSKSLKPLFLPGAKGKAHYSDTNFQLLGKIIENITKKPLEDIFKKYIYAPLGLVDTYVYSDREDRRPKNLFYKKHPLFIPQGMTSFWADGSIVSTSLEMNTFLRAFFGGTLFPHAYLAEMQTWNPIFFPMQSGIGIHRFKLPWIFNPFGSIPEFIGHSGLSGTVAYYAPGHDLFITGTVNQIAHPDTSFKVMIKLARAVLSQRK